MGIRGKRGLAKGITKLGKRAQAGTEYLMTYGWALIVIAIVIGILILVTSGATGGVTCQSQSIGIQVTEWAVKAGNAGVGVTLRNATGGEITSVDGVGSGQFTGNATVSDTTVSKNNTFTVTAIDAPVAGTPLSTAYIDVDYTTNGDLDATARIICSGTV